MPLAPPDPGYSQTVHNFLKALTYDSKSYGFRDNQNVLYFLFCEVDPGGPSNAVNWNYETSAFSGLNSRALISSFAATVITNGTYNTGNNKVTYQGVDYQFQLQRNVATNLDWVVAVQ